MTEKCLFTDECRCTSCLNEAADADREQREGCNCNNCWESENWDDDVSLFGSDDNEDE